MFIIPILQMRKLSAIIFPLLQNKEKAEPML